MAPLEFPANRFRQAGASDEEIERFQKAFDWLSPQAQASEVERWAAVSQYDIAAEIELSRAQEVQPVDGADLPDAPAPKPVSGVTETQAPKPPAAMPSSI